jgi:lysophospholipase L1-like esterase
MTAFGVLPLAIFALSGGPIDHPDDAPAPAAKGKKVYVVAAMGDSLTDPKSHGGKYLELLRKRCPKSRFDSYGKGGQMVNQMKKRFARDILGEGEDKKDGEPKPRYTHAIVLGGIGDILSNETAGRTAKKIEADLEAMYTMAKKHDITVIAMTLPPWGAAKQYNPARHAMSLEVSGWIRDLAGKHAVGSVTDVYPLLSCGVAQNLCEDYAWPDKLHWNAKGHEIVGKALAESVFADCE